MKHYIEKIQPAKIVKELEKITCALCGTEAKRGYWESSSFEVNETEIEVTVKQKDGTRYPEGGSGTLYQADICPDCFKTKLIPFLKSLGCKAKRTDWDW